MMQEIKDKLSSACYFFSVLGAILAFVAYVILAGMSGFIFSIIGLICLVLSPIVGAFFGGLIFGLLLAFPLIILWEVIIAPILRTIGCCRHH